MSPDTKRVVATVGGRQISLSNLTKVLYPSGYTKGDVIEYYTRIAPVMLPHLKARPVTVKRFPEGTDRSGFIEKNVPSHAPEWVRTVTLPRKGTGWGRERDSGRQVTEFTVVDDLATLTWLANLAAIELHTPMWRTGRDGQPRTPDLLVFDLDPGEPATITECCEVALALRERLEDDGIELLAKTSGSKGLQCYGRIGSRRWAAGRSNDYAHDVAEEIERSLPDLVVSRMTKSVRAGKVLIDWSQNNTAKTNVSPYSLRALDRPSVSTPVTWDEVAEGSGRHVDLLGFSPDDVLARVAERGDLFAPLLPASR